jgi:hypothetical protein
VLLNEQIVLSNTDRKLQWRKQGTHTVSQSRPPLS